MNNDDKYIALSLVSRTFFRARWLGHLVEYAYLKVVVNAWKREAGVSPPGLESSDSDFEIVAH